MEKLAEYAYKQFKSHRWISQDDLTAFIKKRVVRKSNKIRK